MTGPGDDEMSQPTQLENLVELAGMIGGLRNAMWGLQGAIELQESMVMRMERQADNPSGCQCAERVFATIDNVGSVCKACHDRWLAAQPYTMVKPRPTSRW